MKQPTKSFPFGWWTFQKDHYGLVDKHEWESLQRGVIDFSFDWCDWRIIRQGNMNWRPILDAAEAEPIDYYFVEQDRCYGEDPFECLKQSHDFLKEAIG